MYLDLRQLKHPDKVAEELLERLDQVMHFSTKHIHKDIIFQFLSDYRPHDSGLHGKGLAIDGTMILGGAIVPLRVQWLAAERFHFSGLGLYPYNHFIHFDLRAAYYEPEARWWRWPICPECLHKNGRNARKCSKCKASLYRNVLDPLLWEVLAQEKYRLYPFKIGV